MRAMPDLPQAAFLAGASETLSDLAPFVAVMLAGFLVGAWGQAARSPIAVLCGMLLILLAIGGFFVENGSGPTPDVTP
jgi:hypothetical protein